MQSSKVQTQCPVKLDQRKKDRVREVELQYFVKKYLRKSPTSKHELPDHLKGFVEPPTQVDVKAMAKRILAGTHDDKKEADWLNTITY